MLYPLALAHAKIVIWALLPEVTAYGCFWPTCETTFGGLCTSGIPTSSQLKIWPGFCLNPFAFSVSSRRSKYFPMTSGLFAQALAYDRGSAWRSIISGCLLRKESHHPLVTSTWGSRVLAICWAIARTSLRDLAYPMDAHPTRNSMRLASSSSVSSFFLPLLAFSATLPDTLSCKVDLGTPYSSAAFCTHILPAATASYAFSMFTELYPQ